MGWSSASHDGTVSARKTHAWRRHARQPLPLFEPREGLPEGGREECRNGERPCPYVRCEHHLWMRRADDTHNGASGNDPRDALGRLMPGPRPPAGESRLEPRWLEYPTPACCELDILEFGQEPYRRVTRMTVQGKVLELEQRTAAEQVAKAMGLTRQHLHGIVVGALTKLAASREARDLHDEYTED